MIIFAQTGRKDKNFMKDCLLFTKSPVEVITSGERRIILFSFSVRINAMDKTITQDSLRKDIIGGDVPL